MDLHDIAGTATTRSGGPGADAAGMARHDDAADRLGDGRDTAVPRASA
jgi:hypothetical protein